MSNFRQLELHKRVILLGIFGLALASEAREPLAAPAAPALFGAATGAASQPPAPPNPSTPGAASSESPLPANPSPPGSDQPLLPEEILIPPSQTPPPGSERAFPQRATKPEIQSILPPPPKDLAGQNALSGIFPLKVNAFRFEGNEVFSNRRLQKLASPYVGRRVTSNQLEELREAITLEYVHAGYINSGAILPEQDLEGGVVIFKIVEGRLTQIKLEGNWWTRSWWLRHELRQSAGTPLNYESLKTGLQLLRENANIRQINAELEPGGQPGESILETHVVENEPIHLSLELNNSRPPSDGSEIVELNLQDLNLTGHDDPPTLNWGIAHTISDTPDHWEFSGDQNIGGSYQFPISPWKTTLEIHASKSDSAIVEAPFSTLDIKSNSEQYGATLRQPFYESLNNLFDLSVTAERRTSKTFLLGLPFDLSPGSIDGDTRLFVLRFALEYVNRTQQHVLALRSTVNWGIDAFDATIQNSPAAASGTGQFHQKIPDGLFVDWLGQAQYVTRLFNTDNLAVLRASAQLSHDPLVALEQYSLGGAASVRGYRENELLRDNGLFASLELHIPILHNRDKNPVLSLAPFFDIGAGWNTVRYVGAKPPSSLIDDQYGMLDSVGVGLLANLSKYVTAQIYWGYALNRKYVVQDGKNLQDYGLHFTISVNAF
jgi:hemolysin activation/secretion protein